MALSINNGGIKFLDFMLIGSVLIVTSNLMIDLIGHFQVDVKIVLFLIGFPVYDNNGCDW